MLCRVEQMGTFEGLFNGKEVDQAHVHTQCCLLMVWSCH